MVNTWTEALDLNYEAKTTFWSDFEIAEHFGIEAIKDTFKRAFEEWKNNIEYVTELCMVMNCKCWLFNNRNDKFSKLYGEYYYKVMDYVYENFKGKDLDYFYRLTD